MKRRLSHSHARYSRLVSALLLALCAAGTLAASGMHFDLSKAFLTDSSNVTANSFATAYWDEIGAAADSFIKEANPAQNRGALAFIDIRSDTNADRRGFVRFDLSAIPQGYEVLKADLEMCATAVPSSIRSYNVNMVTESWAEGTIRWNNQPAVTSVLTDSTPTPGSPGCMTWSVASDVQSWVAGVANNGWRVVDSVEDSPTGYETTFRSKEDTSVPEERPSLFVVFRPCMDSIAPGAPSNFVATPGNGLVGLDWDDNAEMDMVGYNIYRSQTQGGPYAKLNAYLVRDSTYLDSSVTNGFTYYYVVTAVDKCTNESGYSSEDSATPAAVPPSAPTGLVGTPGFEQVALDWNDNSEPDLAGYNVYRSQTQSGPYTQINGPLVSTSDYMDSGRTNGVTYYYVVTAENADMLESSYSTEASATPEDEPPSAPTGLGSAAGNGIVGLDWNDNSEPDMAGYNVYRSETQGGPYTQVNVSLVSASDYIDSGLTNGITYYYVVTAVDTGANESDASAEASATPDALPPGAPTGLQATSGDKEVVLDWNNNPEPDLDGYNVYRSETQGGPYTKVNVSLVGASNYADTGLDGGVTYYYVVTAVNTSAMESGDSAEASATPYSVLIAAGDSYVRQNRANTNYGSDTEILIRSRASRASRGFVFFDVTSIPSGSTINSAVLTLCATAFPSQTRTYEVRRVTASWVESTIRWNNQPTVSSSATDSATTLGAPGCMSWTVTADVQAFIDGTSNYGWRIGDTDESSATTLDTDFRSREDSSVPEERPTLTVYFTAP